MEINSGRFGQSAQQTLSLHFNLILTMKFSRFFPAALLLVFAAAILAPACSEKVGCPKATHASDVFAKDSKKSKKN